jgi:hypothetical protein
MTPEERELHSYLGEGVYVEWDGEDFILRTGDHRDSECQNRIYLNPSILDKLNNFKSRIENKNKKVKMDE